MVLACFWVKKVTQFVARLGRGAKKCVLFVLKNQWVMKKFKNFEKSTCKKIGFCATIWPVFAPRCSTPHGNKRKRTWSLKTKFAQMYPGQDWPGRDATVEKLVPGNIKLVYLTRGKTAIKCSRIFIDWEFDSGSERTLAAWIRHASRTGSDRWVAIWFCWWEWRKGEDNMGNLPLCWG